MKRIISWILILSLIFTSQAFSTFAEGFDFATGESSIATRSNTFSSTPSETTEDGEDEYTIFEEEPEEDQEENLATPSDSEEEPAEEPEEKNEPAEEIATVSEVEEEIATASEVEVEIATASEPESTKNTTLYTEVATTSSLATGSEVEVHYTGFRFEDFIAPIPQKKIKRNLFGTGEIPNKYDSRTKKNPANESMSIVPPTKNQGGHNTCWAFATMGLIETNLRKQGLVSTEEESDLSEVALAYFTYGLENVTNNPSYLDTPGLEGHDYTKVIAPGENYETLGGNTGSAAIAMSSYAGVVSEAQDESLEYKPLYGNLTSSIDGKYAFNENAFEIKNAIFLNKNDTDAIKQAIMDYGAVSISFFGDGEGKDAGGYDNVIDGEHYQYPSGDAGRGHERSANHAIIVVGWDDTIPATNFRNTARGTGATNPGGWLCKNSWGNYEQSNNGFFWMSYDEPSIWKDLYAIEMMATDTYKYNYHYDTTTYSGTHNPYYTVKSSNPQFRPVLGNIFKANGNETLDAVNVVLGGTNNVFEIQVYTNESQMNNPTDGTLKLSQKNINRTHAGIYTIELNSKVVLKKDLYYSIVILAESADNEEFTVGFDFNYSDGDVQFNNDLVVGQSQAGYCAPAYDYYYWETDPLQVTTSAGTNEYEYNWRIKGLTNPMGSAPAPAEGYYVFTKNWFDGSTPGISKSSVNNITFLKYYESVPTGTDVTEWDLPSSSHGLKGYTKGNDIYIYAPADVPIKMPEDASYLFSDESSTGFIALEEIKNLDYLDTSDVKKMDHMFYFARYLDSLDLSNFNTSKVTDMTSMFEICNHLTELDLSSFDTSQVTNMSNMFANCSLLSNLNISSFNTENVTDMSDMFSECKSIESLNLNHFKTPRLTNMDRMFYTITAGTSKLKSLNLRNFDTSNVTSMNQTFYKLSSLATLDLRSFDTSKVTNMCSLFAGCTSLQRIYTSNSFTTAAIASGLVHWQSIFGECSNLKGGNGTTWTSSLESSKEYARIDAPSTPGFFTASPSYDYVFSPGWYNSMSSVPSTYTLPSAEIERIEFRVYGQDIDPSSQGYDKVGEIDGSALNTFGKKLEVYYKDFYDLDTGLYDKLVIYAPKVDASEDRLVTIRMADDSAFLFGHMFFALTHLTGLDRLSTENVTNMSGMFLACDGLKELDLSSFGTKNVINMSRMFESAMHLTSLNLAGFDTRNVTDMSQMFTGCGSLTRLDLSTFDTRNVTNMKEMFAGSGGLTKLNLSSFDTSNVTDMSGMFHRCFNNMDLLDLSNFNTSKVENFNEMFYDASLKEVNVSSFDTSNATSMRLMFCDFSGRGLEKLDISNFNTSKVTDMTHMISAPKIATISVANLDTSSAQSIEGLFWSMSKLKDIDVSNFNTSNANNIRYMFWGCSGLEELDLANFDTSRVTRMDNMFENCSNLQMVNLTSFNTNNVTEMQKLFKGCSELVTVKASSDFVVKSGANTSEMFSGCTKIKGGNNTGYSDSHIDGEYARIDTNTTPGYFTDGNQGVVNITFNFDMNGHGTQVSSKTVEAGRKLTKPTDPTETGYTFKYWYETDPNTAFDFTQTIPATSANPRTLYAKWEENTYTITFHDDGGTYDTTYTKPTSRKYTDTTTLPTSANITKTGYNFIGWYDNSGKTGTIVTEISANTAGPHEYWLKWEEATYNITLHEDGGTYESTYTKPVSKKYTATAALPTSADIKKTGYVFKGWYDNGGFTGSVKTEAPANVVGPYEYWLKWNKLHTVTFDLKKYDSAGTGTDIGATPTIESQSVEDGLKATRPTTDPSAANHEFLGWYHYDTSTHTYGAEFNFDTETITADTVVYAKWHEVQTITFTFDMNGHGASIPESYVVEYQKLTRPTNPTETGYRFIRWYEGTDDSVAFDFNQNIDPAAGLTRTLHAKWLAVEYTITYDAKGGTLPSGVTSFNKTYGMPYTASLASPSMIGYEFDGWYRDDNTFVVAYDKSNDDIYTTETATYKIFAKWSEKTYSITLHDDGGTYESTYTKPTSKKYTATAALPTSADIKKTGYVFKGWYDNSGFTGTVKTEAPANVVGPYEYWLKWNKLHTVTFDLKKYDTTGTGTDIGATPTIDSQSVEDGLKATRPTTDPSADGHRFEGWYHYDTSTHTYGAEFNFATETITADTTIYAKWYEIQTITFNFNMNGHGTQVETKYVVENTTLTKPTNPTAEGYTFKYWYESDPNTEFDFTQTIPATSPSPRTLNAKWEEDTYNIALYNNGGVYVATYSEPTSRKYTDETILPTSADITKVGHTFDGWYTQSDFSGTKVTSIPANTVGPHVFFLKWDEDTYSITLNDDGGTYSSTYTKPTSRKYSDDTVLPTSADISKVGYTFAGWYDNSGFTGMPYTTIPSNTLGPHTYYLKWNENSYDITLYDDGGTYLSTYTKPTSRKYTDNTALPTSADITKTGYTFDGWYDNSGYTGSKITSIPANTVGPHTYYLKWNEVTYNITLHDDGGTYESTYTKPTSKKYTATAALPTSADIKKTGYVFKGWYDNGGFTGSVKTEVPANVVGPYEYWLKWNKLHTVTFNLKKYDSAGTGTDIGATPAIDSQSVEDGLVATRPSTNPTAANHRFEGWYHYDITTHTYGAEFNFATETITADTVVYAKWYEIQTITFNFDMNGHGTQVETQYVVEDTSVTKPADPTVDGWTFKYWYETDESTAFNFNQTIPATSPSPRTLYAKWEEKSYTITLYDDGGTYSSTYTKPTSRMYTDLTLLPTSTDITKTGYTFDGWYDNSGYTGTAVTSIPANTVGPHTYYLKWNEDTYNITLHDDGGTYASTYTKPTSKKYTESKVLPTSTDITKTGYVFKGWYDNSGFTGNVKTTVPANVVGPYEYWLKWNKLHTVTFDLKKYDTTGTGTDIGATPTIDSQSVEDGLKATKPATNPTANGHRFLGWYHYDTTSHTYGDAFGFATETITADTTIYAKWYEIQTITVNFDMQGHGTQVAPQYVPEDTKATKPANPTATGYTFKYWYETDPNTEFNFDHILPLSAGATRNLHAKWEENTYTITLNDNGGTYASGYTKPTSRKYTDLTTLPTSANITKAGHNFIGWYDNSGYTGTPVTTIPANTVGPHTYWLKWEGIGYNVTLYSLGGSKSGAAPATPSEVLPYTAGTGIDLPMDYERDGQNVILWYERYDETTDTYSGNRYTKLDASAYGDKSLYARYGKEFTITYDANGGTGTMSVRKVYDFEDVVLDANTFARKDYTFDGWDGSDNKKYKDKEMIGKLTGDLTLKARWKSTAPSREPSGGNNRGNNGGSSTAGPVPNTTPGPTQNQSQAKSAAQTLSEGNVAKTTMSSGSARIESIVKNTEAWRYDPVSNKWQITGLGMAGQVVMASNTFCQVSKTYTMNVNGVDTQVDVQDTYYFDEKGSMVTGWMQSSDGKLYFFEDAKTADEGKMALGWKKVAGIWYYFSNNGTLLTNAVTPDGYIVGPYGEILNS